MKKGIQSKLNAYAAAAGTMALAGAADAQVVYTDINPDTIVHDTVGYVLDFDNNGVPELRIETDMYVGSSATVNFAQVTVLGSPNNAVIGSLYYATYPFPTAMNTGDSIAQSNANWQPATFNNGIQYLGVVTSSATYANWIGVNDKYLGVRFQIGANTHYGWVRLSVSSGVDTIIVKDYAYQVLPGVGITAGLQVGIPTVAENNNITIFSSANTIVIRNTEAEKGGIVRITNTLGQTVSESQISEENMRITLDGQAPGIYFVEVIREDLHYTKKVYVH